MTIDEQRLVEILDQRLGLRLGLKHGQNLDFKLGLKPGQTLDNKLDQKLGLQPGQTLDHKLGLEPGQSLDEKFERTFATFFGQFTRYLDKQLATKADKAQVEKLQGTMDGLAKQFSDEEAERAGIKHQQNRHNGWIKQIAKKTDTKLHSA